MKHSSFFLITVFALCLAACQPAALPGEATIPSDWLTYSHPKANFSFAYPPDAKFYPIEAPADSTAYGYAYMIVDRKNRIDITVLANPDKLSINEFLDSSFANRHRYEPWPLANYSEYVTSFQVEGRETRQIVGSEVTSPFTGIGKYSTFIDGGEVVVVVDLLTSGRFPTTLGWEPTPRGAEIYQQVVSSIQFNK